MRRRFRGITFLVMALWVIGLTWVVIYHPDLLWDREAKADIAPQGTQKRLKNQILPEEIQRAITPKPKTISLAKERIERATKLTKDLFEESEPYAIDTLFPEGAITFDELDQYVARARFKVTEQSLEKLRSEGVPDQVLDALKNIQDQDFVAEANFLTKLNETIVEPSEDYTPLILKHAQYSGYFLRTALEAGQPLLDYKLYFDRQKLIEDRTAIDMRAMSVRVDEVVGVAGYIKPYSWVDILVTFKDPHTTKTVLRDILVLAVGDIVERKKNEKEGQKKVSVVTLQVTPEQAEELALASSEGKLRLALRNPLDTNPVQTKGVNLKSLLGSNTPRRRRAPSQKVTVIKGSDVKTQFFK